MEPFTALYHALRWTWASPTGYNIISGDLADITLVTAVAIWVRNRNCHVHRCWRLSWHAHPVHGHPVCKHHHPQGKTITADPA